MSKVLSNLEPQALWNIFEDICQIPHPSKKEEKIIEFAKNFGESLGLETIVDHVGNVIIRKPATPGMENRAGIILQGHLDMVPQKNNDTVHDFEKDPITPIVDGDWVKAKGTTLGADNGIGAAAAMAVLQDKNLKHGPIEVLLTIDEETGMTGAFELKPGLLKGQILVNLDSEDEGELYIGCAGGIDTLATFNYQNQDVAADSVAYKLEVKGLKGGHSGLDIHLGRGNANKILNRILWEASRELGLELASIDGGSLRNAIPREAMAIVTVPGNNSDEFEKLVSDLESAMQKELGEADPSLKVLLSKTQLPKFVIESSVSKKLFDALYACPNGAMRMISDMPEVVETSTNMAIVKSLDGKVEVACLSRSSVDSAKDDLANMLRSVFELAAANVETSGSYPGWKPNLNSPILKAMKDVYEKNYGKVPAQKVIHAGLECGILAGAYPSLDMISFGPTIRNPHSPDEKVNIKTVKLFWDYLVATLENAPLG
jgi:dipeptidase D